MSPGPWFYRKSLRGADFEQALPFRTSDRESREEHSSSRRIPTDEQTCEAGHSSRVFSFQTAVGRTATHLRARDACTAEILRKPRLRTGMLTGSPHGKSASNISTSCDVL